MKLISHLIARRGTVVLLLLAALPAHAQGTKLLTITATAQTQGGTNNNLSITTLAAPAKLPIDTKQILAFLAVDENALTNYPDPTFPAGAQLVLTGTNNDDVQVWDKNNNLLVDVSDIIRFTHGTNVVIAGKTSDMTGLAAPTVTRTHILTLTYDDLAISKGSGLFFYLQGIATTTVTDTTPDKAGVYSETISTRMSTAMGGGNYQGAPLVVTGGLRLNGGATLKTK